MIEKQAQLKVEGAQIKLELFRKALPEEAAHDNNAVHDKFLPWEALSRPKLAGESG